MNETVKKSLLESPVIFYVLIMSMMKPEMFDYLPAPNRLYNIMLLVSLIIIPLLYVKMCHGLSQILVLMFIQQGLLMLATFATGRFSGNGYRRLLACIFIIALSELSLRTKPEVYLKSLYWVLALMIVANVWTMYLPDWGFGPIYFFGYRVTFIYPMLTFLVLGRILIVIYGWQYYIPQVIGFILICFSMYKQWVGTGLVGISIYCAMMIIYKLRLRIMKYISTGFIVAAATAANIAVLFFRIQDLFKWLIVDILGKSLTLSGRIYIWDAALNMLPQKLWFGFGVGTYSVHCFFGDYGYMHNQILQCLMEGGIVTTVLFFIILGLSCFYVDKYRGQELVQPIMAGLVTYSVIMISEVPSSNSYFYIMIALACFCPLLVELQKKVADERADKNRSMLGKVVTNETHNNNSSI
ncbi:MAG: hypothetical protein K6G30_15685 [Acetatifactor sp.]|nr:hypothetical protein [Acetatifactor sp.]